MALSGWVQIGLVLIVTLLAAKPLGLYMAKVFSGERTFMSPLLGPIERGIYWLSGVDAKRGQGWLAYTFGVLRQSSGSPASSTITTADLVIDTVQYPQGQSRTASDPQKNLICW